MVGWGIIGIGNHAGTRMAPAFQRTPNSRLLAVCSRDRDRALAFASKHGAEAGYDSFDQLLEHRGVEVVYVATPHNLHKEYVVRAAQAGKHVMCEKPMALRVSQAEEMIAACRSAGVTLGVCFQNRQHPAHVEARRLVASGEVGDVRLVRSQYSRSGRPELKGWRADPAMGGAGGLMGLGLHAIDVVRYVTGQEIAEVSAMMDSDPSTGVLDNEVAMLMRLTGGGFVLVNNSRRLPWANNDLIVNGSRARVSALGTVGTYLQGNLQITREGSTSQTDYADPDAGTGLYASMIEDFSRSVEERRAPMATGDDGLAMVRMVDAILQSVKERRAVRLQ